MTEMTQASAVPQELVTSAITEPQPEAWDGLSCHLVDEWRCQSKFRVWRCVKAQGHDGEHSAPGAVW